MHSRRNSRRPSFIDVTIQQGRRPSIFEQAANLVQLHSAGNHSFAVPFNYSYLAVILAALGILLFFVPILVMVLVALPLVVLYYVTDFLSIWDPNWTLQVAFKQYLLVQFLHVSGIFRTWIFHRNSFKVGQVQEQTLRRFVKLNADTAYGRDHGIAQVYDREDLVRTQPLTKFPHYADYIERTKNGEVKVLTRDPALYFGKTSGTTGKPSVIPFTSDTKKLQIDVIALHQFNVQRQIPWEELHRLRPLWKLSYTPQTIMEKTPAGILMGPMSANPFWTKLGEIWTAPAVTFQIEDAAAGGYVQLVFALSYRQLGAIDGVFASLVYFSFKRIESDWKALVKDIRHGTLKDDLDIPKKIRDELLIKLKPDPKRADELEMEFSKGFDNIGARIWPELKIINCITTGPFSIYAQYLRDKYTKDILLYPIIFAATEGIIGVNFWPHIEKSRYALLPEMFFYEFIPLDKTSDENPETIFMDQVELGRDYELVLTMSVGIYRYRMGDVVRIVSFYNEVPVVEYRLRVTAQLGIRNERVTEVSIFTCLNQAVKTFPSKIQHITDWSSVESPMLDLVNEKPEKSGAYHIILVEFNTTMSDAEQIDFAKEFSSTYDDFLRKNHYRYNELRHMQSLGESVVWPIRKDGFIRLREYMLKTTSTSPMQLKIPRVISKKELLHFLIHEKIRT